MEDLKLEVETLVAIFGDELSVQMGEQSANLNIRVCPTAAKVESTASHFIAQLSVTLKIIVNAQYPKTKPIVELNSPRGLTENDVTEITVNLESIIDSNLDCPVLFDIIQCTQNYLDEYKVPSVPCPICLTTFQAEDVVINTVCSHHFHTICLCKCIDGQRHQHLEDTHNQKRDFHVKPFIAVCPVCRMQLPKCNQLTSSQYSNVINDDLMHANANNLPLVTQQTQNTLKAWREKQKEMLVIYEKQMKNGGIIDQDVEKNKRLVTGDTKVVLSSTVEKVENPSTSDKSERNYKIEGARPKQHQNRHRYRPSHGRIKNETKDSKPKIPPKLDCDDKS